MLLQIVDGDHRHQPAACREPERLPPPSLPQVMALPCPNIEIGSRSGRDFAHGRFLRRISNAERTEHCHGWPLRGITVVLGGPHVTLIPEEAAPHDDAIVIGYAEDTWPQLLRDFAAGQLRPRYCQSPMLDLANRS